MPSKRGKSNDGTVAALAAENKALGRELWLMALNDGKGDYSNRREPRSSSAKKSFTNLSPNSPKAEQRPFLSTPQYLRSELAGIPPSNGTPNRQLQPAGHKGTYKLPEEYYDEVMELKKRISTLKGQNELLKSKYRRLEEENTKKEKMLENLLDPAKNEQAFSARKGGDSSLAVHSLKQKIFKLEKQLKDKDTQYQELSSQIKYTKQEEMKTQLEVLYGEVLRLRSAGEAELRYASEEAQKANGTEDNGMKQDALIKTIKRLNEDKEQLAAENQHLREELDALLGPEDKKKYGKGSPVPSYRKETDHKSLSSVRDVRSGNIDTENKIALEGNLRERLDALDKRESDLLNEISYLNRKIARLEEDRDLYKKKWEDKSTEVKELNATISRLKKDSKMEALPSHQLPPRGRPTPAERKGGFRSSPSAAEIEEFRRQHAARVIQRGWRKFHQEEENNAIIQSAMRGFLRRDRLLSEANPERGSRDNSLDRRDRKHDGKEDRYDRDHRRDRNDRDYVAESPMDLRDERRVKSNFRKPDSAGSTKSKSKMRDLEEDDNDYYKGRPPSVSQISTKRSSSSRASVREAFQM